MNRRKLVQTLALGAGCSSAAQAQEPAITPTILRDTAAAHGIALSEDRLRVLQPVLERRIPQRSTMGIVMFGCG